MKTTITYKEDRKAFSCYSVIFLRFPAKFSQATGSRYEPFFMKQKKETRGGYRPGSGRKALNGETTTIAFRVPVEHVEIIKTKIKAVIKKYQPA